MNILVRCIHGSHLYGLNTATSDKDYKSVFVPPLEDILLYGPNLSQNLSTKTNQLEKNTAEDVDVENFSLATFIKHLCDGEMIAVDMMHSEPRHWLESSSMWEYLRAHRKHFYTKSMRSYLGYIKKQVAKYSFKGSRLNILKDVADSINEGLEGWAYKATGSKDWIGHLKKIQSRGPKFSEVFGLLPINDHCRLVTSEGPNHIEIQFYEVFGSKYMLQDYAKNVFESISKYLNEYGKRAHLAAENEGVDWKAVSHAFRACYQAIAIYEKGGFKYPLPETDKILEVKLGKLDYKTQVEPELEKLYHKTLGLADSCNYPDRVDEKFRNDLLLNIYGYYFEDTKVFNRGISRTQEDW